MRKYSLIFISSLCSILTIELKAQNTFTNSGTNVGIRTTTPIYPFQVFDGGTNVYTGISFLPGNNSSENGIIQTLKNPGSGLILRAINVDAGQGQTAIVLKSGPNTDKISFLGGSFDFRSGYAYSSNITNDNFGNSVLNINTAGKIGVGTTLDYSSSYKLAVEGKLGAREIIVTTAPWADFVFKHTYCLRPLSEVEAFIRQNGHLPDVPTEEEIKKNGNDLGKTDAILLQKVEELTLYMIELKKENEELKKKVEVLEKERK